MPTKLANFLLDLLAPRRCLCCRVYDTWLCDDCLNGLTMRVDQQCHYCKKTPTSYGNLCADCRGASPLRSIFVATDHTGTQKQLLSKVVHHYKYYFIEALAEPLGTILASNIPHASLPLPDMIVPVPLHTRRLHWRGFNQSTHLAHVLPPRLTQHIQIPVVTDLLVRTRYTTPQVVKTDRAARANNLLNAFHITDASAITGKSILLVDDIATTGTTLTECATILKKTGAFSVDAIVLSRG